MRRLESAPKPRLRAMSGHIELKGQDPRHTRGGTTSVAATELSVIGASCRSADTSGLRTGGETGVGAVATRRDSEASCRYLSVKCGDDGGAERERSLSVTECASAGSSLCAAMSVCRDLV